MSHSMGNVDRGGRILKDCVVLALGRIEITDINPLREAFRLLFNARLRLAMILPDVLGRRSPKVHYV